MKYDFDVIHDRKLFHSVKWNQLKGQFGREDLLPLWVADMDFKSPQPVINALREGAEHGIYGYTGMEDSYYAAIISWMKKRHHWPVRKEWISFSPGVVSAIAFLIRIFSQPGDKIIIQPPVYYPFSETISRNGRQVINNPLILDGQRYLMDFVALEKKLADPLVKLLILCNPHNPVGRVWDAEALQQLGELCLKHHVLVIADEIHSDIIYPGFRHLPFPSISKRFEQNCVVCTSPSKTFNLAGLKTSAIIIPNRELFHTYDHFLDAFHLKMGNYFGIIALEAAYQKGEDWLEQLLLYLSGNLAFLKNYLAEYIPEVKLIEPEGTYLVWLDFRDLHLDTDQLNRLLLEQAKVALDDGCWFGQEGQGFQRINIGCPRSGLKKALDRIRKSLNVSNIN